jgi:membrane peptidoglycan carboxypeptidase
MATSKILESIIKNLLMASKEIKLLNHGTNMLERKHEKPTGFFASAYFFVKPLFTVFRWSGVFVCAGLLIATFFGVVWVGGKYNELGSIKEKITTPPQSSVVYDRNGEEMFKFFDDKEKREIVNLEQIPEVMQLAVIAMEDENFYYNDDGIPWTNLFAAAFKCLKPGSASEYGADRCRGGSGLSQQLMKKTITQRTKASVDNKIDELLGAYKFNQEVSKQDVLRIYLNVVPFGRNTAGVQAASMTYFGHKIDDKGADGKFKLSVSEACLLGSMLPKPEAFAVAVRDKLKDNKSSDTWEELVGRKNSCIEKLGTKEIRGVGTGSFIQHSDVEKYKKENFTFVPYKSEEVKYGHIKNFLMDELVNKYKDSKTKNPYDFKDEGDVLSKGLQIKTTFDTKLQKQIEDITAKYVKEQIIPNGGNNAAAIVLDGPTGQIIAMVGSADFNNKAIEGEVNIVTAPRQPGSSIKPYVFASAFERGFNPATLLLDTSIDFGSFKPLNFDKKFYGAISMRNALQNSLNIPAVKALYLSADPSNFPNGASGLDNFKSFTDKLGLKFPFWEQGLCGVATALGACEVKMIDHATGINTILQEGKQSPATPFLEIKANSNSIVKSQTDVQDLYSIATNSDNSPYKTVEKAIDPDVARQVANVMSDTQARYPSIWGNTSQYLTLEDWSNVSGIAAKTGTTSDVKDMWVVGGSPYYTVLVWAGNTDGKPMKIEASSSGVTGPYWKSIMALLHKDKVKKGFSKAGLKETELSGNTGLLQDGGKKELLTDNQIKELKDAKERLSKPEYKFAENSIFTNRTIAVSQSVKVNKLDSKLIPDNDQGRAWPTDLTTIVSCAGINSEFPRSTSWGGGGTKNCPTEVSDLSTDKAKIELNVNLSAGQQAQGQIVAFVKNPGSGIKTKSIEIKIGGQFYGSLQDSDSIQQDISSLSGDKDVEITVRNDANQEQKFLIPAVKFGGNPPPSNQTVIINPPQNNINSILNQ